MEKNSMTADEILIALIDKFCDKGEVCAEAQWISQTPDGCKGCIVNDAMGAVVTRKRILREKKHEHTNTQIRTG